MRHARRSSFLSQQVASQLPIAVCPAQIVNHKGCLPCPALNAHFIFLAG